MKNLTQKYPVTNEDKIIVIVTIIGKNDNFNYALSAMPDEPAESILDSLRVNFNRSQFIKEALNGRHPIQIHKTELRPYVNFVNDPQFSKFEE